MENSNPFELKRMDTNKIDTNKALSIEHIEFPFRIPHSALALTKTKST